MFSQELETDLFLLNNQYCLAKISGLKKETYVLCVEDLVGIYEICKEFVRCI